MASDYDSVELGEVASVRSGFAFKSSDWTDSGVPVVKIANVKDGCLVMDGCSFVAPRVAALASEFALQAGDILIAMTGYIGDVALVRERDLPAALNQRVGRFSVRDPHRLDPRFLFYLLRDDDVRKEIEGLGYGSAQPNISPSLIHGIEIPLPPLPEQCAIARILGALDDKIELNRRMNETLEAMARALFTSWFIDFDPVHAKAEGRDPGLPADIAALFPDSFQGSDLGDIPKGWRIGALADYAELNPESWSADTVPDEVNYVDLANTKWGRIEATQRFSWEEAPSRARRVLRPGDTIVGTVRPGNGSYSFVAEDGLTGSTGFAVLRPRAAAYAALVYLAATEHDNIVHLAHLADGAAYPAVRPEVVFETQVVRPDRPIVECFARCTRYMMERQAANDAESRTLTSLRDSLLPKLLSGELRVNGVSQPVGAYQ